MILTRDELIKMEIKRLHESGSSDFQTLFNQTKGEVKELKLNLPQAIVLSTVENNPSLKEVDCEWGRGTGKTTIVADFVRRIIHDLPRGLTIWQAPTYKKFYTEIIPAFRDGLEMLGFYENLHYFVGKRPPASWRWPEPYKMPRSVENCIWFFTGHMIYLVSQDVAGSGRGLNADAFIEDECILNDIRKWEENVKPALRGSKYREFANKRFFDFRLRTSSTPLTKSGRWFIEREVKQLEDPKRFRFFRADCRWNMLAGNLPPNYLLTNRQSAVTDWVFKAEFLNIRPRMTQDGFYNLLDENKHTYSNFNYSHSAGLSALEDCRGDADLDLSKPLIIGVDWGASINSLVTAQSHGDELRVLKNVYALGANQEDQQDMFRKFLEYYRHHPKKDVFMWFDATGNLKTGFTSKSRADMAAEQLRAAGWKVFLKTTARTNPDQHDRFVLFQLILREEDRRFPRIRINKHNCKELWLSMSNAQTKEMGGKIKKDKSGERADIGAARVRATDLSDAFDSMVWGLYSNVMRLGKSILPSDSTMS